MGKIKAMFLAVIFTAMLSGTAYAGDIGSNDLIEKAKEYDNKKISYSGEVIGDIMKRGDYAWINVSDGNNAIGVWLPSTETSMITRVGSYSVKGDTVRVIGTFHRACSRHGGDMDIHADNIEVLQPGSIGNVQISGQKAFIAIGLACVAAILMAIVSRKRL